jgi:hypothetical protein
MQNMSRTIFSWSNGERILFQTIPIIMNIFEHIKETIAVTHLEMYSDISFQKPILTEDNRKIRQLNESYKMYESLQFQLAKGDRVRQKLAWPSNMSFSATKPGTRCYLLTEPII